MWFWGSDSAWRYRAPCPAGRGQALIWVDSGARPEEAASEEASSIVQQCAPSFLSPVDWRWGLCRHGQVEATLDPVASALTGGGKCGRRHTGRRPVKRG